MVGTICKRKIVLVIWGGDEAGCWVNETADVEHMGLVGGRRSVLKVRGNWSVVE